MRFSHRFFLYAPVAAVVVLAAAASIYWYVTANAFAKRLEALNGHEVAPGVRFHYASKSIGGFPFRVDAVLKNMRVTVKTAHGPAVWRTPHFALHMLDYGSIHVVLEAAGKQVLTWHDKTGAEHGLEFVPAMLRASALGGHEGLRRFDLELVGASAAPFKVAHTEFHIRRDPDRNAIDLVFMADGVHLAPALSNALGNRISKLRLSGLLAPGDAWDKLFAGRIGWRAAAEAWRKQSGAFEITKLEVAWGKTNTTGTGVMTLDSERRPKGLIRLKIAGFQALADEAKRRHLVQGAQQSVLAGLMAHAAAKGGDRAGRLPVTLAFKDGLAYIGDTPAGFLPTLY